MKIRNGFISNSSSSSFIIAFKEGQTCEHCGSKTINLLEVIEGISEENTRIRQTGLDAVLEIVEDENPRYKEILENATKLNKDGFTIARVSIGYELASLFSALIKAMPNVVILEEDD